MRPERAGSRSKRYAPGVMARRPRQEFPGAHYHVTSRGVEQRDIYLDRRDRRVRLRLIRDTVDRFNWRLHAFVLMGNHDHLFLETPEANLSSGMQFLNGRYAGYFNHRRRRTGHLFQGRFHSQLVETDVHYREVSRYIHLNPVRAGIVDRPEAWEWGSYPGYHDSRRVLDWIVYSSVLMEFGSRNLRARAHYRKYVRAGIKQDLPVPWEETRGRSNVSEAVRPTASTLPRSSGAGLSVHNPKATVELEHIARVVRTTAGIPEGPWPTRGRTASRFRAIAAYMARERFGHPASEVASVLGYASHSGVVQAIQRLEVDSPRTAADIARVLAALEDCDGV